YSMFVLLLDAGRMLPGSPTPHMSRHTLVTRAQGPVTLSVLANGAGSRSTDEVRPEPASGSARLPRENPTTRPPGQAGITYMERLQPRPPVPIATPAPAPPHHSPRPPTGPRIGPCSPPCLRSSSPWCSDTWRAT